MSKRRVANGEVVDTIWGPRVRIQVDCGESETNPRKTVQSARKEADINTLVARARASGQWPERKREGVYGDFSGVPDFHQAQDHVLRTRDAFGQLPAEIRDRCANDSGVFIARMHDPEILDLLVKHGLATRREAAPRQPSSPEAAEDAPGEANLEGAGSAGKVKKGRSAAVSGAPSTRSGDGGGHTST